MEPISKVAEAPDASNVSRTNSSAGGFLPQQSLPSPAPSNISSASTTRYNATGLPHPRAHALRPGSAKEDMVRNFVSDRMMLINRRFLMKTGNSIGPDADGVEGYKNMGELCKDLDGLINILWLSGTPSLQIPYFLNIASEFNTWVTGLPSSPAPTFAILRKLDHCFASLLAGEDVDTKEPLPGFERGPSAGMSRTHMVRCKSLVQQARVLIVEVMNKDKGDGPRVAETDDDEDEDNDEGKVTETETEAENGLDGPQAWNEDEERLYMDVARVYEKTLVKLGETLGEEGLLGAEE